MNPCSGPMIWTIPSKKISDNWVDGVVVGTLPFIGHAEIGDAKLLDIFLESSALCAGVGFGNERLYRGEILARDGADKQDKVLYESNRDCAYGILWSTVARVQSGRRTGRPAFLLSRVRLLFRRFKRVLTVPRTPVGW